MTERWGYVVALPLIDYYNEEIWWRAFPPDEDDEMSVQFPAVQKLIDGFLELYPEAEYEFAHIVLSDYNLTDEDIQDALKRLNEIFIAGGSSSEQLQRLEATEFFLKFLECIPEEWRLPDR